MDGTLSGVPITATTEVPAGSELPGILLWVAVYAVMTAIVLRPKKLRPLLAEKA